MNHQIMLGTFQNMTDNGVRLEHFALLRPECDKGYIVLEHRDYATQAEDRYLKEILQMRSFSEL